MTLILGVNAHHADAAACLLDGGRVVAAAEEERFRRVKHWSGAPTNAAAFCLRAAGAQPSDVDVITVNRDPSASLWRKAAYAVTRAPSVGLIRARLRNASAVGDPLKRLLGADAAAPPLMRVEHHRAHLASAFYASPFETAAVVSVDGFGDFASAMWAVGRGTALTPFGRTRFPHSLGLFYQALTQFLGFWAYGDEYKVMGMAAYGAPRFAEALARVLRTGPDARHRLDLRYFRHHRAEIASLAPDGAPRFAPLFDDRISELLGPARAANAPLEQRHYDIAASVQAAYEGAFFALLRHVQAQTGERALCLAGGCAMNSLANGKIYDETPFETVYVPAAAGDAGGAIGAAYAAHHDRAAERAPPLSHAYLGPAFDDAALRAALEAAGRAFSAEGCQVARVQDPAALAREVAAALADGAVVGWFQGAMEWGPRALGARSILADPRRADMKDVLNVKIKRRERFRPFAPSVLRAQVGAWFETDHPAPFMAQVFKVRPEKRALIPAVVHADGTARLQTVEASANPRYAALIEAFFALTGAPMVLNTSFNENEPIVCTPEEAVACFLRTRMDLLVLGDWMVSRRRATGETEQQAAA